MAAAIKGFSSFSSLFVVLAIRFLGNANTALKLVGHGNVMILLKPSLMGQETQVIRQSGFKHITKLVSISCALTLSFIFNYLDNFFVFSLSDHLISVFLPHVI